MIAIDVLTKYQACILCSCLHRNINNNFISVSFKIDDDGEIILKIVLKEKSSIEDEYIDDITAEYEALQEADILKEVQILVDKTAMPLENVVYQCFLEPNTH